LVIYYGNYGKVISMNIEKLLSLRCCRRFPFKELFENYLNRLRNNRESYRALIDKYGVFPSVLTPSLASDLLNIDTPYRKYFIQAFKNQVSHVKRYPEKYALNEIINFDKSNLFDDLLWFAPGYVSLERELEERLYYYLSYNYDVYRQYLDGDNKYDIYIPNYIIELKVISNSHDLYRYIGQVNDYKSSRNKVYGMIYVSNIVNLRKVKNVSVPTIIKYSPDVVLKLIFKLY